MAEKVIMLGNEAIARGAYEAGVKVSSAYPGTPSTEISEYLVQYKDDVYEEWAPNEKVATEVAVGASLAGGTFYGMHEACRFERGGRSAVFGFLYGSKRRTCSCCCR